MRSMPKPKKKVTKRKKQANAVEVWIPPKHLLDKTEKPLTLDQVVANAGLVLESCNNDPHTAQFFLIWLQNGHNGTDAYQTLHPKMSRHTASVLGARELAKVSKSAIMEAIGLGYSAYFEQMRKGLNATKVVGLQGDEVDDHKTRRLYHEAQGKILGIEQSTQVGTPQQVNVATAINNWIVTDKNEPQTKTTEGG